MSTTKKILFLILLIILFLIPLLAWSQTIPQVERELIRQQIPHHKIVLAQARLETGNFKSKDCCIHHNLFGIKHNGKYARYKTWQESIADYKRSISSKYKGGDYYAFLINIKYAEDKKYIQKLRKF